MNVEGINLFAIYLNKYIEVNTLTAHSMHYQQKKEIKVIKRKIIFMKSTGIKMGRIRHIFTYLCVIRYTSNTTGLCKLYKCI